MRETLGAWAFLLGGGDNPHEHESGRAAFLILFVFQSLSSFLPAIVYPTEPLHTAWTGFSSSFLTYVLLPELFIFFLFFPSPFRRLVLRFFLFDFFPGYCYEGVHGAVRYAIWGLSETVLVQLAT